MKTQILFIYFFVLIGAITTAQNNTILLEEAKVYIENGNYNTAKMRYDEYLQSNENDIVVQFERANCYLLLYGNNEAKYSELSQIYKKIIDINEKISYITRPEILNQIGTQIEDKAIYLGLLGYFESDDETRIVESRSKLNKSDSLFNLAASYFKTGLEDNQNSDKIILSELAIKYGDCQKFLNNKKEAEEFYLKGIAYNDTSSSGLFTLAEFYKAEQKYDRAINYYEKFLNLSPNNRIGLIGLGDSYKFNNEYEKALDYYSQHFKYYQDSYPWNDSTNFNIFIGDMYFYSDENNLPTDKKKENITKAIDFYNRALSENGVDKNTCYLKIGRAYYSLGDYNNSIKYYLLNKPKQEEINNYNYDIALAYRLAEDWKNAIKYFSKVSTNDFIPEFQVNYLINMTICYERLNDKNKLMQYLIMIENKDPKYNLNVGYKIEDKTLVWVYTRLSDLYSEKEDYYNAKKYLMRVKDIEGSNEYTDARMIYYDNRIKLSEVLLQNPKWELIETNNGPLQSNTSLYLINKKSKKNLSGGVKEYWIKEVLFSFDTIDSELRNRIIENRRRNDLSTYGYDKYSHSMVLWQVKCNQRQYRVMQRLDYDINGSTLESNEFDSSWNTPIPDSIAEGLMDGLCK